MKVARFSDTTAASGSGGSGGGTAGPAAGDLGGGYPAPAVTGIQGTPVSTVTPTSGQALIYDGTQYKPTTVNTEDGMVPYYIPAAATFTVPLYKQALFKDTIEADGILIVLGRLLGVD